MDAGQRDKRVVFQKPSGSRDTFGKEKPDWVFYARAWANVRYGRAEERRSAAQDQAILAATFNVPFSAKLAAMDETYRITFAGLWDITSVIVLGQRDEIEITATKIKPEGA